jgi:methylated-DNA-protein-cysteine methyltransferase-like protein
MKKITFGKTFSERILERVFEIPVGRVTTYGYLAKACGGSGQAARSVSGILGRHAKRGVENIPWHRIVYGSGKVWINSEDFEKRKSLYKKEKIRINEKGKIQDFDEVCYKFGMDV